MSKLFLYLYPIKEFTETFLFPNDSFYDSFNMEKPLPILNDTINKRYRRKGFQIVYVLYPDKNLYGIEKYPTDKIIYTDILFSEASAIDEEGKEKDNFIPKYPNEELLINQLGDVDKLIVGGYHAMDCVKRVAEAALKDGIDTLVDLDLTDLFFVLYNHKEYFNEEIYDLNKFKEHMIGIEDKEFMEKMFNKNYSSPVYGFSKKTS